MDEDKFRFFTKIYSNIDVKPLLGEIVDNEDLWLVNTSRQDKNKVQENTQGITLRGAVPRPDLKIWENQESLETSAMRRFPKISEFLYGFAEAKSSKLSRAKIVRLKPGLPVGMHTDKGSYYLIRNRFHLVLKSTNGSILQSGDEIVTMKEGELWWFDNKQHHSALNNSTDWRIHVIFDLLPIANEELATNPVPLRDIGKKAHLQDYLRVIPIRVASLVDNNEIENPHEH